MSHEPTALEKEKTKPYLCSTFNIEQIISEEKITQMMLEAFEDLRTKFPEINYNSLLISVQRDLIDEFEGKISQVMFKLDTDFRKKLMALHPS